MATIPTPNSRASLLSGLRTGGVRSTSGPMGNVPHTAAPTGTFNVPRHPSAVYNGALYSAEEEDELADMVSHNLYINNANRMQQPMTAAVDGSANRFAQQQGMAAPMSPYINSQNQAQLQALQLQMMQVEIARLQALQAQQYQAELMAQAQRQRVPQQQPLRRSTVGFVPPATASPTQGSFDFRAAPANTQVRRAQQAEQLRARLGFSGEEQVPMTAALNGKFGMRAGYTAYDSEEDDFSSNMRNPPATPSYTTVISGGTSLGGVASANSNNSNSNAVPSKSDAAVSWRRGTTNNSVLKTRTSSAPLVKVTPPPSERVSPPPASSPIKTRPTPLTFINASAEALASAVIVNDGTDGDDSSSVSSRSGSSPSTPRSASSIGEMPPLSPREEASKKLYEGLGIGRPAPTTITVVAPTPAVQRLVSQPLRQPKGPPSNNDELAPKNFATRSRRKAIGALLGARERREVVEAY
ncbi:hypothetical protein BXZ70DRAFT_426673 [Cristinia sonorae]|uniref:Uncharacterized protein n=1 Tax=Cristinia sonorae TaxID=1940300 RepID=A0A8K0UYM7_9AGAR|nr:hypothetical protein BXZ70DRAFT_426673 [Cristinia sonorae]